MHIFAIIAIICVIHAILYGRLRQFLLFGLCMLLLLYCVAHGGAMSLFESLTQPSQSAAFHNVQGNINQFIAAHSLPAQAASSPAASAPAQASRRAQDLSKSDAAAQNPPAYDSVESQVRLGHYGYE